MIVYSACVLAALVACVLVAWTGFLVYLGFSFL